MGLHVYALPEVNEQVRMQATMGSYQFKLELQVLVDIVPVMR